VGKIKGAAVFLKLGGGMTREFPWLKKKLPSLWTRSYFVSTAG
jgi:REP element-mobilizing transposase RayT